MAKIVQKLTSTERLNSALADVEQVVKSVQTHTMRDALYDYVYSKLEEMEEKTRKIVHTKEQ